MGRSGPAIAHHPRVVPLSDRAGDQAAADPARVKGVCAMAKMETAVVIARPVEEVFGAFLALDETAPKIDPSIASIIKTPDGPVGPGTTFRFRQQNLGAMRQTTTRFTAVEPNKKIEFEAEIGPMRPKCALTFEQT